MRVFLLALQKGVNLMNMHSRDKRKWFAANFGRGYFKSQPLINPSGLIGFALPCAALLLVCVVLLGVYAMGPHAAPLMLFPMAGLVSVDLLKKNKTDWTKQASEILEAAAAAGGFTELSRKAYNDLKAKIEANNELLSAAETQEDGSTLTAKSIIDDQLKNAQANSALVEMTRCVQIIEVMKVCGLPMSFSEKHIRAKSTIDKVREDALKLQAERSTQFPATRDGHITVISDEADTRRMLMGSAVHAMMNPNEKVIEDGNNPFLHLSIKQIAEESVRQQRGVRGPVPMGDVATLAMQTTADFANVLENTARKQLLRMYQLAAPTYRTWCKPSTTPDFKTMTRVRLGEAPSFLKVLEGGQVTLGLMTDSKESYALATYGRGISFTRQMLINDDLGAFNDLISQMGQQAARMENKTVYAILYANANMADSIALFYATHYNLGTGALGNTSYDAAFGAMKVQKGLDGVSVLNLTPKYLIVPAAKESTAKSTTMLVGPNVKASDQNWFAGRLEVVADGELDTNGSGTTIWFMAADPSLAPGIEYCFLQGQEGPQFVRKDNEQGVLGMQFYAYEDFAAKAVDWRSLYKSTGS
jgi:hypothetical protein